MRALWRWFRAGQSLQEIRDESYLSGYRQAMRDVRTLEAAERNDEAARSRQPYPNE